jgi:hypothetical protein
MVPAPPPSGADPSTTGDLDDDGVSDSQDNCLLRSNPLQRDGDQDGFGDACDPDYDNDGHITLEDARLFLVGMQGTGSSMTDHDGNGATNVRDYGTFLRYFNAPTDRPGPSGLACAGETPCQAGTAP